jgi:Zn-dependent peptidase ImmA (M78 family)/DNA-binding phage protein
MERGVTDFVGHKLKKALEARMLNATSLSQLSGVSSSMISHIINGNKNPSFETVQNISKTLNLPISYFLDDSEYENSTTFFRKLSTATKANRISAERKLEWLTDIIRFLEDYIELPDLNLPNFNLLESKDIRNITYEEIEDIAEKTRRYWGLGLGIIPNLTLLLENNGFIISKVELGTDELDGLCKYEKNVNRIFIFLASDKQSPSRSKFDIAHELGHAILHRHINTKIINLKKNHKLLEAQANRFAGAFLLPEESFASDFSVPTIETFLALKEKWGVSVALMILRSRDLGILNDRSYQNMYVNYSRRGYRKNEPLDNKIKFENPTVLKKAFNLILEEKVLNPDQIINKVGLSKSDIATLANFGEDTFDRFTERENEKRFQLRLL